MSIEELIINYLSKNHKKTNINKIKKNLINQLKNKNQQINKELLNEKQFNNIITNLEQQGFIISLGNNVMLFPKDDIYHLGILSNDSKNNGYVDKYFIDKKELYNALPGDLVLIKHEEHIGHTLEKIVKRKHQHLTCIFENNELSPYGIKCNFKIKLKEKETKKLANKDIILVELSNKLDKKYLYGTLKDNIINKSCPNYEEQVIASRHNFPLNFSKDALKEVENITKTITEEDIKNRLDLRNHLIFTIDGDHTKDMDDAVSLDILPNNNYLLGVHIAHVSHYVKKDSTLWQEAYQRATSLYLNNSVIPMLPQRLSNDICSLNPYEDKLTISTFMEFNKEGKCIDYKITPSIITSKGKLTYSNVNAILEENQNKGQYPQEIINKLFQMQELSTKINKQKEQRGYLSFADTEYDIEYDNDNNATKFNHHNQRSAEKIIENFMLSANESVAAQFSWMPFLYRIHDEPNINKLRTTLNIIKNNYEDINIPNLQNFNNKTIQNILNNIKTSQNYRSFSNLILPCMARAEFSAFNRGHFGLALNYYSQSTSPIRRFNDLMIQSLIDDSQNMTKEYCETIEPYLYEVAKHCSLQEREADLAEKEAEKILMAKYIEPHIGKQFYGTITKIGQNNLEIETEDNIKGIIPIKYILNDTYHYDRYKMKYISKNNNTLQIGDKLLLNLKEVSTEFGTIKFELLEKLNTKTLINKP